MEISKKQILLGDSEAFQRLLQISYVSPSLEHTEYQVAVDRCRAVARYLSQNPHAVVFEDKELKTLLTQLKQQLPELNEQDFAYVRFCFEAVLIFQRAAPLDSNLNSYIVRVQMLLFVHGLNNIEFWITSQPLKNIIDSLCLVMLGWQSDFGQHSDNFLELLASSVTQLEKLDLDSTSELHALEKSIEQQIAELQSYSSRFAERMKDAELGKIKNQASQYTVLSYLKQLLFDKALPTPIADYVRNDLVTLFHQLLATEGLAAKRWEQAKSLLPSLIALYQPNYQLQEQDKVLPTKLQAILFGQESPNEKGQDFINNVTFDISQMSVGKSVEDSKLLEPIEIPEHLQSMEASASQDMLSHAQQAKEGQWYLLNNGQMQLRCLLLANLTNYKRVLLSNFVGQRVLVASYDEFAYFISTQKLQSLPTHGPTLRCLHNRLDKLLEVYQEKYAAYQQLLKQLKQEEKEQQERALKEAAAEKARLEAQEIARQHAEAARKAEEERLALEHEKLAREQEQLAVEKAEQEERMRADLRRHARLSLDSLTLGAWAELVGENNSIERIKLAVKFAATGRFIFVNDEGITILEEHRDNLVEMLLDGKLSLLESDQKFAERLAKIVSDLRTL